MAEIVFQYEGKNIIIQCNKNQKMLDICNNLSNKINTNLDSLVFLYGGSQLKFDKKYEEITKENKIIILVYKIENENEYCSKCGRILNNKIIDDIILINNNINSSLIGLKIQLDNIINDINNKKDIIYINSQLKNINYIINGMNEDIKKINNQLNQIKFIPINNINNNKIKEDKIKENKNEIICIYNKQDDEINILHDYNIDISKWPEEEKKSFIEAKNDINGKNIDIYINDKKIEFNYKYKSKEKGDIKVKFIFSTYEMFYKCSSLKSADLSSFNTTNVNNMRAMFNFCSSLESVNLSSLNTTKVKDMGYLFAGCESLKSADLSSFNTTNVNNMESMFNGCESLKSLDLSSFNTTNVNNMDDMFDDCSSLKKENVKISKNGGKIMDEIKKYLK